MFVFRDEQLAVHVEISEDRKHISIQLGYPLPKHAKTLTDTLMTVINRNAEMIVRQSQTYADRGKFKKRKLNQQN